MMTKVISFFSLLIVLCGCSNHQTQAPIVNGWQQPSSVHSLHRVRQGETLYAIAWGYGFDYRDVAAVNHLHAPYTLRVGQPLKLPSTNDQKATTTQKPTIKPNGPWRWPIQGKVVKGFSLQRPVNKGIDIVGPVGAPVRASRAGEVVYSGDGIPGYGHLIILKHNDNFLSAYAHNQRNLVKEGMKIKAGQQIAEMGNTALHFEIRQKGRPVDPRPYLS